MSVAERLEEGGAYDLVEQRFERIGSTTYAMSSPGYKHQGAPRFIVEILSSNRSHDMVTKLNLYEKAGVTEYWMIDPEEQIINNLALMGEVCCLGKEFVSGHIPDGMCPSHTISVLELVDGKYTYSAYSGNEEVSLASIPGCTVNFKEVFALL